MAIKSIKVFHNADNYVFIPACSTRETSSMC